MAAHPSIVEPRATPVAVIPAIVADRAADQAVAVVVVVVVGAAANQALILETLLTSLDASMMNFYLTKTCDQTICLGLQFKWRIPRQI